MRRTHFVCTVEWCGRKHHAHGFCNRHGHRYVRHGDPRGGGIERSHSVEERFARFIRRGPGLFDCWEWIGTRYGNGYGQAAIGDGGRINQAHRVVYEALVGPIPEGLELDHLCRNPSCVNPDHLEPVTHAENMRRMGDAHPSPICSEAECDQPSDGRGLCKRHYNHWHHVNRRRKVVQTCP